MGLIIEIPDKIANYKPNKAIVEKLSNLNLETVAERFYIKERLKEICNNPDTEKKFIADCIISGLCKIIEDYLNQTSLSIDKFFEETKMIDIPEKMKEVLNEQEEILSSKALRLPDDEKIVVTKLCYKIPGSGYPEDPDENHMRFNLVCYKKSEIKKIPVYEYIDICGEKYTLPVEVFIARMSKKY